VLIGAAERSFEAVLTDPARVLSGACRDAPAAVAAPSRIGRAARVEDRPERAGAPLPAQSEPA
jgi:hypothetical protein